MEVVQLFVGADGVHIGVDAVSAGNLILRQRHPFPLCQRVDDLGPLVAHIADGESHRPFDAVEVVVDAQSALDKQRRRDTPQPQLRRQALLEKVLYAFDGLLRLGESQVGLIILGKYQFAHIQKAVWGKDRKITLP